MMHAIHESWQWVRLGDVCKTIMGQSPPGHTYNKEGRGSPFFQGKIDFGKVYPTPSTWCTEPRKMAQSGDILICVRAPVGPTNLCNQKSCIGRGLAAIRTGKNMDSWFLLYFLRSVEEEISRISQGSTFTAIKREQIEALQIPLPPLPVQQRIAAELKEKMAQVEKLRNSLEKQIEAISALPQAILMKAFSGEL